MAERAAFKRFMVVFTLLQFAFAFSVWAFYSNLFALFAGAPPVTALYVVVFSASVLSACRGCAAWWCTHICILSSCAVDAPTSNADHLAE